MKSSRLGMRTSNRLGMRSSRVGMRTSREGMRSRRVGMRSRREGMRSSRVWGWDLAELGMRSRREGMRSSRVWGWDLAERLERLTANAKVATVLGSIPASSGTVESEGRQMKQCWIKYLKILKNPWKKNLPEKSSFFWMCVKCTYCTCLAISLSLFLLFG